MWFERKLWILADIFHIPIELVFFVVDRQKKLAKLVKSFQNSSLHVKAPSLLVYNDSTYKLLTPLP